MYSGDTQVYQNTKDVKGHPMEANIAGSASPGPDTPCYSSTIDEQVA